MSLKKTVDIAKIWKLQDCLSVVNIYRWRQIIG